MMRVLQLLASTASGIVGEGREFQDSAPTVAMWMASMPGCSAQGFHMEEAGLPELDSNLLKYLHSTIQSGYAICSTTLIDSRWISDTELLHSCAQRNRVYILEVCNWLLVW